MPQKLLKIDSVMYFVKDLERAEKFYQQRLGLRRVWKDEENKMVGFKFESNDSEIVIHSDAKIPSGSFSYLVKDVKLFCQELKEAGFEIVKEPFAVRCGFYATFKDPEGNQLDIIDLSKFGGKPRFD